MKINGIENSPVNTRLAKKKFSKMINDFRVSGVLPSIAIVIGIGPGFIRYLNRSPLLMYN